MSSSRPQFPRSTRKRPVTMTPSFGDQERPAFYDRGFLAEARGINCRCKSETALFLSKVVILIEFYHKRKGISVIQNKTNAFAS